MNNDKVVHSGGGNFLGAMREKFNDFMRQHIVDDEPTEEDEAIDDLLKIARRKPSDRASLMAQIPGRAPLVTSGNPDYIARLAKICERLGYKVTVRE